MRTVEGSLAQRQSKESDLGKVPDTGSRLGRWKPSFGLWTVLAVGGREAGGGGEWGRAGTKGHAECPPLVPHSRPGLPLERKGGPNPSWGTPKWR